MRETLVVDEECCINDGDKKPEEQGEEERELSTVVVVIGKSRSQAAASRRVTPTPASVSVSVSVSGQTTVEKTLPNGDFYQGDFSSNAPHGTGTYLWTDGCMYQGEWRKGKAWGKGKFSWPSGATFEGDFKSGRMEGNGTLIGSDGDTYRGGWTADRKHGTGQKSYANGDFYDGSWKRNLMEGRGRYVWKNGNEYVGEWKNGVINGRGVLIWANGNRFDGQWENGVPKGDGVFSWSDGSCYVGSWSKDFKQGTFYPNSKDNFELSTTRKRSSVERNMNYPRICIWESDGEAGDITCDIIDNVEASMLYRDGMSKLEQSVEGGVMQWRNSPCYFPSDEAKKPGQTISKGHKNYELMLNLQLGIRYSVGKHASNKCPLKDGDFDPREKFWTKFPPEGSKLTPPHQSVEFRWKDYCPVVFRRLRELFAIDPADYMLAICGNDALRELSSPGKSGSCFYLTLDDRFMIKTVKKSEVKVLLRMLSSYYQHVCKYEKSLVTKFFGVHCVKPVGGQKVYIMDILILLVMLIDCCRIAQFFSSKCEQTRFIIMGNLFCSEYRIHRRFDLKGSSYGRSTGKPEGEIDETTTLKDLDLNYTFRLQQPWFQELIRQIDLDCEFLEAERIMDYSLLVGLHFRDDYSNDKLGLSPSHAPPGKRVSNATRGCRLLQSELKDMDRVLAGRKPLIRLGANMPARAEQMLRCEFDQHATPGNGSNSIYSTSSETYEVILYFGIIDILQDYDISKKLEHAYKSLHVDSTSISAVDPKQYSKRFRDFIRRIFVEDNYK
ncbi:hypothetical protein GIB67_005132 [Kingdonia uniflora]|uniref:Phosphatidylinositol 4-phosphate 5-kinase n=1 Tax=Kingdonia uniflora TaxID=39325 RepID=A0A7J7LA37_9MAGN|nr:hypothetical protein GIB67_005132 [Kingdonia uniflora]